MVKLALRVTSESLSPAFPAYINYGTSISHALSPCAARKLAFGLEDRKQQPPHNFYRNTLRRHRVPVTQAQIGILPAPATTSLLCPPEFQETTN